MQNFKIVNKLWIHYITNSFKTKEADIYFVISNRRNKLKPGFNHISQWNIFEFYINANNSQNIIFYFEEMANPCLFFLFVITNITNQVSPAITKITGTTKHGR